MRNTSKKVIHVGLITLLVFVTTSLAQQLVTNGSFDTNAIGWNSTNNGFVPFKGNPNGSGFFDLGTESPSPTTDPFVSQLITGFVSGATYVVSGDYELGYNPGGGSPGALSFGVALDGVYLFEAATPTDFYWHTFNFSYVASSSSAVLSLAAERNNTSARFGVDNISIVPEPSVTVLLCGFAGLVFGTVRRRKFRRA